MKKALLPGFVLLIIFCFSCQEKKEEAFTGWYKGNLHTHSYWSDGDEFPEMIMEWYKSHGYDFIALSDHNILAEGEKWKLIPKTPLYEDAFNEYLKKYGEDWVEYKQDTGRISVRLKTYSEYKPLFEEKGKFLIIQSEEITDHFNSKPLHMNATNIQELIRPKGGNSVVEVLQNNLNSVIEQRSRLGIPIMAHINHPNFGYGITAEDLIRLKGDRFFEVYNGHPTVNNRGDSSHIDTETMWDIINSARADSSENLVYGLATDDTHNYHLFGNKYSNAGRGWVMVKADNLDAASLINAMEDGSFYASTGVTLTELTFENNLLSIKIKKEEGVTYRIDFIGKKKGSSPDVFQISHGDTASFTLTNDIQFVRAKITSSKKRTNPVYDVEYESAWIQPVTFQED